MVGINRIMMQEATVEDGKSKRTDSTIVETDIQYPMNLLLPPIERWASSDIIRSKSVGEKSL